MNKYESMIIVNPNATAEEIKELIEYIKTFIINNNGNVITVEELGKKKLAYDIKKNKEAYYIQFNFEVHSDVIAELERIYRIKEIILKFIVVRL